MVKTEIEVRYGETDKMGVVYHANYFPWFEIGRENLIKTYGMTYAEAEDRGVMLPLTQCNAKFIHSAKYGDKVWVEAELDKFSIVRCRFSYRIVRVEDGLLLAEGYTEHCFTNTMLEPINLKKVHPDFYKILLEMSGDRNDT